MIWRVLLVVVYGGAWAVLAALHNGFLGLEAPASFLWLAAPVVGFLIGRWWALFAIFGWLVGSIVGWDEQANYDQGRLVVYFYAPFFFVWIGAPLLRGVAVSLVPATVASLVPEKANPTHRPGWRD